MAQIAEKFKSSPFEAKICLGKLRKAGYLEKLDGQCRHKLSKLKIELIKND